MKSLPASSQPSFETLRSKESHVHSRSNLGTEIYVHAMDKLAVSVHIKYQVGTGINSPGPRGTADADVGPQQWAFEI